MTINQHVTLGYTAIFLVLFLVFIIVHIAIQKEKQIEVNGR